MLLMLPVVATLIAFIRQVIGIKAFGIYTPLVVIFAFWAVGLKYGIAIFVSVIAVGMVTRVILRRLRILYLPRVAVTLTIVTIAILAVLVFGGSLQRTGLAAISILPVLIMITIVEKFVAAQIEKGDRTAVMLAVLTLAVSVVGFFIVKWQFFVDLVLKYPWIILLTIPINIILGKWTGLRLSEYFRFREIFKKM
jgi:hypothetical protein